MERNDDRQLKVSAIKNGTVLDHIPSCQVFKVIDILGLSGSEHPVTFGVNLDSKSMGRKGIIKISERFFKDDELNKIALIAPNASVNIIRDFKVVEKKLLTIPETICGIVKCIKEKAADHPGDHLRYRQVHQPHVRDQPRRYPDKVQDHRKRL